MHAKPDELMMNINSMTFHTIRKPPELRQLFALIVLRSTCYLVFWSETIPHRLLTAFGSSKTYFHTRTSTRCHGAICSRYVEEFQCETPLIVRHHNSRQQDQRQEQGHHHHPNTSKWGGTYTNPRRLPIVPRITNTVLLQ